MWPLLSIPLIPPEALGRPSRKAATAALTAHVAVLGGTGLKGALSEALRGAKNLGGQERRFAALATRELSRHQRLLDQAAKLAGQAPGGLSLVQDQAIVRYALWRRLFTGETWARIGPEVALPGPLRPRSIPDARIEALVRAEFSEPPEAPDELERAASACSFPSWLAEAIAWSAPPGEAPAVLAALNVEASLIVRTRGGRDACLAALADEGVDAVALPQAPDAVAVASPGARVFETRPMKAGRLQVMDLGSQLIVELCRVAPGATVVDWCAGAGGKALALADRVGPEGRVQAWDVSRKRLGEARERARKHGLANIEFPSEPDLGKASVVLVDAPCSGSGSLAREPDLKWKLTRAKVDEFRARQAEILSKVVSGAAKGTAVVYATCSLLREEDEEVVEAVLTRHPGVELDDARGFLPPEACAGPFFRAWPHRLAGGGFFGARLVKRG